MIRQKMVIVLPSKLFLQVWRRHFLVWRKGSSASLVGTLGEPFLYLMAMGYGLGKFVGTIDGSSYLVFVAAGILAANSMNTATFESLYGGFTRMTRQNTFHAMLTTPLRVSDVVAGEVAWAATKSFIAGIAILLVGTILGAFSFKMTLLALPVIFLSGVTFGALAMMVTAVAPTYDFFLYYFTLVTTPMFLFCGVFYPVHALPESVGTIVDFLPLTHVIQLIRPLANGVIPENSWFHLSLLTLYAFVAFCLAVALVRKRILV